jgi:hypothetical protein
VVLLAALAPVAALIGWAAPRGLDRTDDGFYLGSIAHPRDVTTDLLAFGDVYHPLLVLVGGDVTALRVIGALLTVAAGTAFAWVVLGTPILLGGPRPPGPLARAVVSVGLGAAGLLTQVGLPPTPSYNTLNLQALLGVATGLVLALSRRGRTVVLGWALVGAAGWLAFLAKPTSAAVAAALVLVSLLVVRGRWRAVWVAPAATVLTAALTMLLNGQTPAAVVARTRSGVESANLLGGHESLVRWDPVPHPTLLVVPVVALALAVTVLCGVLAARGPRVLATVPLAVVGAAFVLVTAPRWERSAAADVLARDGGFVLGALAALGLVVAGLAHALRSARWRGRRVRRVTGGPRHPASVSRPSASRAGDRLPTGRPSAASGWVLTVVLVLFPAAFAFGTNGNLWSAAGRASVLVLVPLTARLVGTGSSVWLAPALTAALVLTPLQVAAFGSPYRYPSLTEATVAADLGPAGTLLLTRTDAPRAAATVALGERLGVRDAFVIDLTGASPGTVFLLGGRPVGQVWVFGGYPGSEAVARHAINGARCAAERAFVLDDPTASRRIDAHVLDALGRDLARDYEPVGELTYYRAAFSGRPVEESARAVLYRPVVAPTAACG